MSKCEMISENKTVNEDHEEDFQADITKDISEAGSDPSEEQNSVEELLSDDRGQVDNEEEGEVQTWSFFCQRRKVKPKFKTKKRRGIKDLFVAEENLPNRQFSYGKVYFEGPEELEEEEGEEEAKKEVYTDEVFEDIKNKLEKFDCKESRLTEFLNILNDDHRKVLAWKRKPKNERKKVQIHIEKALLEEDNQHQHEEEEEGEEEGETKEKDSGSLVPFWDSITVEEFYRYLRKSIMEFLEKEEKRDKEKERRKKRFLRMAKARERFIMFDF